MRNYEPDLLEVCEVKRLVSKPKRQIFFRKYWVEKFDDFFSKTRVTALLVNYWLKNSLIFSMYQMLLKVTR